MGPTEHIVRHLNRTYRREHRTLRLNRRGFRREPSLASAHFAGSESDLRDTAIEYRDKSAAKMMTDQTEEPQQLASKRKPK